MSEVNNSVIKSLEILEMFMHHEHLSVAEMSDISGYSKSAITRIINSLASKNYIYKSPESGKYLLGNKLYYLGECTNLNTHLVEISKGPMEELAQRLDITITLSVMDDHASMVVYKKKSRMIMGVVPDVGSRRSLNVSASGKVLVAFSEDPHSHIEQMTYKRYTDKTITDKETYAQEIRKTRESGYAIDDEELEKDLFCVAMPILNSVHRAVGTISVSGYRNQVLPRLEDIKKELKNTVTRIAGQLN